MTVPGRIDSARLLLSLDPPPWFLRHARAVAEVAAWLAARTTERHEPVDRAIVEGAGLLHDVDKLLPDGEPARRLRHGQGSAAWLTRCGHPELAAAVADHPVTRLADGAWFERWFVEAPIEAKIVAYADKRAGQRLEPLASRFGDWERRFPEGRGGWAPEAANAIRRRAERLESEVCALAGVAASDVGRLAWTGPALARARTSVAA